MAKTPNLDEATLKIAQRLLSTPPKPHDEMKLKKSSGKPAVKPRKNRNKST
jgi:hypothetical protein